MPGQGRVQGQARPVRTPQMPQMRRGMMLPAGCSNSIDAKL
jgi:hypothetical protein